MKKILLILFLFVSSFCNAQVVYQKDLGTPKYSTFTFLYPPKDHSKVQIYYTDYDTAPELVAVVKDTVVSGVTITKLRFPEYVQPFFMVATDPLHISIYNSSFSKVASYECDSMFQNANLKTASVKKKPFLTDQQLFSILKLLLL